MKPNISLHNRRFPANSFGTSGENGGQNPSANNGSAALKGSGRQPTHTLGGQGSDHIAEGVAGNGLEIGGGRAASGSEPLVGGGSNSCARPVTPDFAVGTDRANRHAPEDL